MRPSIDETYAQVVQELPLALRPLAGRMLVETGFADVTANRWDAVFQLEPCRDLPRFTLSEEPARDPEGLARFLRAHHCACFHGVLVDRLADGQAGGSPGLESLAEHLLLQWKRRLAEATGDAVAAEQSIARALRAWRLGVSLEQGALARGHLTPRRYARLVLLKLGWATLASEWRLHCAGESARVPPFRHACFALMLGMQCLDDAVDAAEDAALHGMDLPTALGVPRVRLMRASAWLTRAAIHPALQADFGPFTSWLSARAASLTRNPPKGSSPGEDFAGYVLASLLEETCHKSANPSAARFGGTTSSGSSTKRPDPRSWRCGTTPLSVP